jgi:hypothetical protein
MKLSGWWHKYTINQPKNPWFSSLFRP